MCQFHLVLGSLVCQSFNLNHSDRFAVVYHCGSNLHFLNEKGFWASSYVLIYYLCIFLGKVTYTFFENFYLNYLFSYWVLKALCTLAKRSLSDIVLIIFFSLWLVFFCCSLNSVRRKAEVLNFDKVPVHVSIVSKSLLLNLRSQKCSHIFF